MEWSTDFSEFFLTCGSGGLEHTPSLHMQQGMQGMQGAQDLALGRVQEIVGTGAIQIPPHSPHTFGHSHAPPSADTSW